MPGASRSAASALTPDRPTRSHQPEGVLRDTVEDHLTAGRNLVGELRKFQAVGANETQLIPTSSDLGQLRRVAEVRAGRRDLAERVRARIVERDTVRVSERNVLGGPLEPCSSDPLTGFYRDGCCSTGPEDLGLHTICAVVTADFLEHQRAIGNDLSTPRPQLRFPGLSPGDRWCVTAGNWLLAHRDGRAAPVVLASTHERTLDVVPLDVLREHAVDVPDDLSSL
jgi:uncharacterized protein